MSAVMGKKKENTHQCMECDWKGSSTWAAEHFAKKHCRLTEAPLICMLCKFRAATEKQIQLHLQKDLHQRKLRLANPKEDYVKRSGRVINIELHFQKIEDEEIAEKGADNIPSILADRSASAPVSVIPQTEEICQSHSPQREVSIGGNKANLKKRRQWRRTDQNGRISTSGSSSSSGSDSPNRKTSPLKIQVPCEKKARRTPSPVINLSSDLSSRDPSPENKPQTAGIKSKEVKSIRSTVEVKERDTNNTDEKEEQQGSKIMEEATDRQLNTTEVTTNQLVLVANAITGVSTQLVENNRQLAQICKKLDCLTETLSSKSQRLEQKPEPSSSYMKAEFRSLNQHLGEQKQNNVSLNKSVQELSHTIKTNNGQTLAIQNSLVSSLNSFGAVMSSFSKEQQLDRARSTVNTDRQRSSTHESDRPRNNSLDLDHHRNEWDMQARNRPRPEPKYTYQGHCKGLPVDSRRVVGRGGDAWRDRSPRGSREDNLKH